MPESAEAAAVAIPPAKASGTITLQLPHGLPPGGVMRNLMKWLDPKKDPVIVIRVT